MGTKLRTLRDFAPYVLIEPLLPGGTVVALLLWLSQAFLGGGLARVRQYLHAPRSATLVAADRMPQARVRSFCRKNCAVVAAWRNSIVQWCNEPARGDPCCAARVIG